jgi:hypothetical protein
MLGEMAPRSARADTPYDASRSVRRHVVVDGSNIATEGRETPSLAQLDEAVQAYMREYQPEIVTVVVDATFPNRIARSERNVYEAAAVAGEIITPPAGAIGRGDAFILQIAERAEATILSNDSFQEFHGVHDWLFQPGRLVGGKPVPHVGWVFMDRTPVRGPLSRRSVSAAKRVTDGPVAVGAPAVPAAREPKAAKAPKATKSAAKATKATKATKAAKAAAPAARGRAPEEAADAPAPRGAKPARADRAPKSAKAAKVATDAAPAEVDPAGTRAGAGRSTPAPANDALPFIEFVGAHPVGSRVAGVVEQFSSHGAYVRIGSVQAYAPLKYLAEPAPRSAKLVLRQGETRDFVVVSVDGTRRGIDLALPGVDVPGDEPAAPAERAPEPVETPAPRKAAARRRTGAAKAAAPEDPAGEADRPGEAAKADKPVRAARADKKAPARKRAAGGDTAGVAEKATPAKKQAARKAAAKKTATKTPTKATKAGKGTTKAAAKRTSASQRSVG